MLTDLVAPQRLMKTEHICPLIDPSSPTPSETEEDEEDEFPIVPQISMTISSKEGSDEANVIFSSSLSPLSLSLLSTLNDGSRMTTLTTTLTTTTSTVNTVATGTFKPFLKTFSEGKLIYAVQSSVN